MESFLSRTAARVRRSPIDAALAFAAVLVGLYAIWAPLAASRYPAITDLPFHAAASATLRHYFDPNYHFREQFEVHPLSVPYVSMYALGALLMLFLPMLTAVKVASAVMLALLPIGLAVLFRGMKKSPLLGLTGLGFVWCNLTHWGFLSFLGALGLFAMAVGLALMLVDKPTRGRKVALAATLVLLFFTHVFRFPMALVATLGTPVLLLPATRRFRPAVAPVLPSLALFIAWYFVRPTALAADFGPLSIHDERLAELPGLLFGGFRDPAEAIGVERAKDVLFGVALVSAAAFLIERRPWFRTRKEWAFGLGAAATALACLLGFLLLFLVLPMQAGDWWYIYPREATSTAFIALALLPDLPRAKWLRAALLGAIAASVLFMSSVVSKNYALFGEATEDFYAITREIPKAPKLLYLIFDHTGSTRTTTPFIHLPAYVAAEKGGWLSFHFSTWNTSPLVYRDPNEPGAVVPPKTPTRWEWKPGLFNPLTNGVFFDWFLVRQRYPADRLFITDPTIERVDHMGDFWLYRRKPSGAASEP